MEKVDYKHGKFTLATTDATGFDYQDYVEWCEDNDMEPGDENSDEYWDWCYEEAGFNWENDLENIKYCKEYNVPCVITGHLGLWWGHPEIAPVRMETVYDAILKCIDGRGAQESTIEWEDGEVKVYVMHHDGTNCFTINALSKKGIAKQNAPYKSCDVKRLPYLYAIGC